MTGNQPFPLLGYRKLSQYPKLQTNSFLVFSLRIQLIPLKRE